jgi:endonuclease/exonuclease/phosphatase family metal-dependent hydrolase
LLRFSYFASDHVLLTAELNARVLSVSIDGSGYPTTSSGRIAALYSDHLPVIVTLSDTAAAATTMLVPVAVMWLLIALFF